MPYYFRVVCFDYSALNDIKIVFNRNSRIIVPKLTHKMNFEMLSSAIIVLGRVDERGNLTLDAHERIRFAAEIYRSQQVPLVIACAKGSYKLRVKQTKTEASRIRDELVSYNIPRNSIALEEKSCDTIGSALFVKKDYVLPNHIMKIIVVTSLDHLERTKYAFTKVFGNSTSIRFVCGRQVMSSKDYSTSLLREKKSLQLMENTWFGKVKDGDHEEVESILMKKHPGYSTGTKLTAKDIEYLVENQDLGRL